MTRECEHCYEPFEPAEGTLGNHIPGNDYDPSVWVCDKCFEAHNKRPKFINIGKTVAHDGETYVVYTEVRFPDGLPPKDDLEAFVQKRFPAERCQHSHDCCGNYYPYSGDLIHTDDIYNRIVVTQSFHLNV